MSPQGFAEPLRAFPCHHNKVPLTTRWQEARVSRSWDAWPLVGVATGAASGFDVLDIDPPDGLAWYDANFDALPTTRAHTTKRGGLHLLFRSAPGLRSSASRIAAGVDVRADGGYVIWWPREGLAVDDAPLCEWPDWLLREAMGPKSKAPRMDPSKGEPIHDVGDLAEALRKLKPERWRNSEANPEAFLEWFALMQACKFVGIERGEFVEWSISDPVYAGDADQIARMWDLAQPKHGGAFWAALKEARIKQPPHASRKSHHGSLLTGDHSLHANAHRSAHRQTQGDWRVRFNALLDALRAKPNSEMLFWVACVVAEIMVELRKPTLSVATKLLADACGKSLAPEEVRRTISNAFRHVEVKVLEVSETTTKEN